MKQILAIEIPRKELGEYKDYVNHLFINESGVYNICTTEEDVMKSNQWFKNLPLKAYIVSNDTIKKGDKFITECVNRDLNLKVFEYLGENKEGIDLIDLKDETGEVYVSTIHMLTDAKKVLGEPSIEQLKEVVNKQSINIKL